ncbi:MAG: hypothetical protein NT003_04510 [Candidatus Magasanikbacteria bacterium]|nr:hypothetical protein [Candidatus Magasanikbacteria bacterium]
MANDFEVLFARVREDSPERAVLELIRKAVEHAQVDGLRETVDRGWSRKLKIKLPSSKSKPSHTLVVVLSQKMMDEHLVYVLLDRFVMDWFGDDRYIERSIRQAELIWHAKSARWELFVPEPNRRVLIQRRLEPLVSDNLSESAVLKAIEIMLAPFARVQKSK